MNSFRILFLLSGLIFVSNELSAEEILPGVPLPSQECKASYLSDNAYISTEVDIHQYLLDNFQINVDNPIDYAQWRTFGNIASAYKRVKLIEHKKKVEEEKVKCRTKKTCDNGKPAEDTDWLDRDKTVLGVAQPQMVTVVYPNGKKKKERAILFLTYYTTYRCCCLPKDLRKVPTPTSTLIEIPKFSDLDWRQNRPINGGSPRVPQRD